ncbi:MAG: hypothetical protein NCW75_10795 [Phycisphaera sp.]|nr:MAG: hypothetical protein NCW75_10795 [Phycisphaera sp.]
MKPNRRAKTRPYVRRRSLVQDAAHGAASRLAGLAGRASRPDVEPLEPRQLLFALTIDPSSVDPTTGIGFAQAYFGYTIPYLLSPDAPDMLEDDEVVEENFDDAGAAGTPIISQTVLPDSLLFVRHNIAPTADFRYVLPAGVVDPQDDAREVEVLLQEGEQFTFSFLNSEDDRQLFRGIRSFSIDFLPSLMSTQGLDLENTRVSLLFRGEVVDSFEGRDELANFRTGGGGPSDGIGTFVFSLPPEVSGEATPAFDAIRFESIGGPSDRFRFDNVSAALPPGNFVDLIETRIFGAVVSIAGTAGTTANFFDLYGRPISATIALGVPENGTLTIVDPNDDGRPEFNDGIGRIVFTNADEATTLTMFGANIEAGEPDPDADFSQFGFTLNVIDDLTQLADDFESAGFGFRLVPGGDREVDGLTPTAGSVIIGSPYVRDISTTSAYDPFGAAVQGSFVNPDQGIFALGTQNVGTINVHGLLFGSSVFNGAANQLGFGSLLGSITVKGDLGSLTSSSDAGLWSGDDSNVITKTGAQLLVERTLGQVHIAGRSLMDTTVVGELASSVLRQPRDVVRYVELESPLGIDTADDNNTQTTIRAQLLGGTIETSSAAISDSVGFTFFTDVTPVFGAQYFRNDSIGSAEFIGNVGSQVQIVGDLSFGDPVNTGEDNVDVFAIPLDGSRPVVVEGVPDDPSFEFRLVDARGRQVSGVSADEQFTNTGRYFMEYQPEYAGVYYLVVSTIATGSVTTGGFYALNVSGMAPVTLGAYRTASGMGFPADTLGPGVSGVSTSLSLNVLSGSVGSIRAGTHLLDGAGGDTSADDNINFSDDDTGAGQPDDQRANLAGGSYTIAGSLLELYAGSDIETDSVSLIFQVGGDLGYVVTGQSEVIGTGPTEGDLYSGAGSILFNISGSIGYMDISGAIGLDYDFDQQALPQASPADSIVIRSGSGGGRGDIGFIRVGSHVASDSLSIITSAGSTVGGFAVSQDVDFSDEDVIVGIDSDVRTSSQGVNFDLGPGSDIRFVDTPNITNTFGVDAGIDLIIGESVELVDDAGGRFTVSIDGAGPAGSIVGFLRFIGIDSAEGVALATIEADLSGNRTLNINTLQGSPDDVISIGRIDITGAAAQSSIEISGEVQVDIWQILQSGGAAFDSIRNNTPLGDIVAIDVVGINEVQIIGDLGRTQLPSVGPRRISPFVGIGDNQIQGIGRDDTFDLPGAVIDPDWGGSVYRPVGDNAYPGGGAYLTDVGSPFDPYLDGLFVRTGNLTQLRVGGGVGDVILSPTGVIQDLVVNAQIGTPAGQTPGAFDGIFGTIYAGDIIDIDVGMGLAQRTQNSLSTTGIFAVDDIDNLEARNATLSSSIVAANNVFEGGANPLSGIDDITLINSNITDAYIGATNLDEFWVSVNYADAFLRTGEIRVISSDIDSSIFRTSIAALSAEDFQFNGNIDAVQMSFNNSVETIQAGNIVNSTGGGTPREVYRSFISIGGDLDSLIVGQGGGATSENGVFADTFLEVNGEVRESINGRLFQRSDIRVAGTIRAFDATNIRSTQIITGQLTMMTVAEAIRASEINVSGPLVSLMAEQITATNINVTGPDGRLDLLQVASLFDGEILATGPVTRIEATAGDLRGSLETRTPRGTVANLVASRDMLMSTDISGTLSNLTVGRNLGDINDPGVLLIRGDLAGIEVANGGLYSDIRVANAITGSILIGARPGLPGNNLVPSGSIEAYGRIESVVANGDYAGDIMSFSGGIGSVTINNGSLLPGGSVSAFNGDIGSLVINAGHLLGDVHADRNIFSITVNASEDGVFGDIGINPALSSFVAAEALRNQLPPNVGISAGFDGPSITAGRDIGVVTVTNGSVFEAVFHAKNAIGQINVNGEGNIANDPNTTGFGTQIVAGNSVGMVTVSGSAANLLVAGGIYDLGTDGRAGGVGLAEDVTKAGRVRQVTIAGDATDVAVSAGIVAGADGIYNTADDLHTLGVSVIDGVTVNGTVTNVSAHADTGLPNRSAGITTGGQATPVVGDSLATLSFVADQSSFDFSTLGEVIASGTSISFTRGAASGTISFSGPGTAVWDAAGGHLLLISTGINSNVTITSDTGALEDFSILSNDDASMGRIEVQAVMFGNSNIVVDGYAREIVLDGFQGSGNILVGNDVQLLETGSLLTSGTISATLLRQLTVNGDLGGSTPQLPGEFVTPTLQLFGTEGITVQGSMRANISVDNGIRGALFVNGSINNSSIRSGNGITSVTAFDMSGTTISAANNIGSVDITANVLASLIMSGTDLGRDAAFGGEGANADSTNGGNIGSVTVGGNFLQSSISAGVLRGVDGFLGTTDDIVSGGRSDIGSVTIGGTQVGSNRGSETFGVFATGTIGGVTVNGEATTQQRNFTVSTLATLPQVVQVNDIEVVFDGGIYIARVFFNQEMNAQTLRDGLIISEVRDGGIVKIRLDEGQDYLFEYDSAENAAVITFSDIVTRRDLPQLPGVAGPGLYRFELDPDVVRGQNAAARLDADGDGFADPDRFFAGDAFVGDVGDKITPNVVTIDRGFLGPGRVDFYGPGNLDTALDSKFQPDALPDTNTVYTLRGFIGDHPDTDAQAFSLASDVDLYSITLQAGQILQVGANTGSAFNAFIDFFSPGQNPQLGIDTASVTLPAETSQLREGVVTFGNNYLITQTGTFFIAVSNTTDSNTPFDPAVVENIAPAAGIVGSYSITLNVFDDGDSGFSASTNAGNGRDLVEAPFAQSFSGVDGVLGSDDDRASVTIGAYTFTRNAETGVITGTDGDGVVSSRLPSGVSLIEVTSAIGETGASGVPGLIAPDVDVFHLNNRQAIQAGDEFRLTVKLSETGADLGGRQAVGTLDTILQDFSGAVQFGLFNTTNSTGVGDGEIVFSPSEFATISGTGSEVFAQDDLLTYGTDENGDFFIVAQAPETGTYAFYIQGVFNADYVVEIERTRRGPSVAAFAGPDGTFGTFDDPQRIVEGRFRYTLNVGADGIRGTGDDSVSGEIQTQSQNVLLEFNGGSVDWLEVGGVETDLLPFSSRALGFSGTIDGLPVDTFVQRELVDNLNDIFQGAGYDITFSGNASAFQGQDFSTVFVTDSNDPINFTFSADPLSFFFNPFDFGVGGFGLGFEEIYGYAERSDPFNADRNDEAAVFVPQLTALGFNPSDAEVRDLTDALSAAVGRRVGELLGLRATFQTGLGANVDVFAANSPGNLPTGDYIIPAFARPLSSRFDQLEDTQFFLGQQNSQSLLDSILSRL